MFFLHGGEDREVHLADWFWMDVQDWSQCCNNKYSWHAFHWQTKFVVAAYPLKA
jgi:hypothetical protein